MSPSVRLEGTTGFAASNNPVDEVSASKDDPSRKQVPNHQGPLSRMLATYAARSFLTVIAIAPLPFGSSDRITTAFWCFCLALCLGGCDLTGLRKVQKRLILAIISIYSALLFIVFLQMVSPPWLGSPNPLWTKAQAILSGDIHPSIAVARFAPLYSLGPSMACLSSLILGIVMGCDPRRAYQILAVFSWSGLAYAVYGIAAALIEPTMILWKEREDYIGNVLGTFTYRNTAAVYFGCCANVWFLGFCQIVKSRLPAGKPHSLKNFYYNVIATPDRLSALHFSGFFICLTALLLTASRAGTIITIGTLIGTTLVYFHRDMVGKMHKLAFAAIAVAIAFVAIELFGGAVSHRITMSGFGDDYRLAVYKSMLRMLADHPWWGTGFGTFPWAFPEYRDANPSLYGTWNYAHSIPLELASEVGIPFTVVVCITWLAALGLLLRGALIRRRETRVVAAALAVLSISLLHAMFDFSLQISGFSIVAMAVTGAGLAQSFRSNFHATGREDKAHNQLDSVA